MDLQFEALGLPPMTLAERTTYRDSNSDDTQKCFHPWLKKFIGTITLTAFTVVSYLVLMRMINTTDITQTNEIFVVTDLRNTTNITIDQPNLKIFENNGTKESKNRNKREIQASSNELSINDDEANKIRNIISSHSTPCTDTNQEELCKEIVTKIKEKRNADNNPDDNLKTLLDISRLSSNENIEPPSAMAQLTPDQHIGRISQMRNEYMQTPHLIPIEPHSQINPPPLDQTCLLARLLKNNHQTVQGFYGVPVDVLPQQPAYIPYPHHLHESYGLPEHQSQYHQNRFEISEFLDRRPHPQDLDIFRHFRTTEAPHLIHQHNDTLSRSSQCSEGTLSCNDGRGCIEIKQLCNGVIDCMDSSDEVKCNCKSRVDKLRLCDGYFDCPYGEDEMGCFGCPEDKFSCEDLDLNSQSTCFTKEQRCNNVYDCPNQKDELECNLLSPNLHESATFAVSNTEGFLQRNFKGEWYPVCNNPYMWAHDACRRETGLIIRPPYIQLLPMDPMLRLTYLNTAPGGSLQMSDTCANSSAVYVTCPDLLCGTRVTSTSQLLRENSETRMFGRNKRYPIHYQNGGRRNYYPIGTGSNRFRSDSIPYDRIRGYNQVTMRHKRSDTRVVGGRPSKPAAWPWMVAMYRDGLFHCGGVVITQRWIVSAAHCVQKFWEHYFEIQVGMLRRFSFSPQESNHQVTHIIVNQNYDRHDMKNDLSLLRVKQAILFSRWVRPICLPSHDTAGPDWMWGPAPGTLCTAVGWGATFEHGPDPDHLREVEVPIWAECKYKEDRLGKEICASVMEGGKDTCQGDSGGPLLCKNPLNAQQWYMAGIVSHGDGCARKGEPGVYTRVSIFVKWIKFHVSSKTLPTIQPKQQCPGFKCESGVPKCLPKKRLCDKVVDCLDAEDEMNCNYARSSIFTLENILLSKSSDAQNEKSRETDIFSVESTTTMPIGTVPTESTTVSLEMSSLPVNIDTSSINLLEVDSEKTTQKTFSDNFEDIDTTSEESKESIEDKDRGDMQSFSFKSHTPKMKSDSMTQARNTDIEENWDMLHTTTSSSHDENNNETLPTSTDVSEFTTTTSNFEVISTSELITNTDLFDTTTELNTIELTTPKQVTELKEFAIDLPLHEHDINVKENLTNISNKILQHNHVVNKAKDILESKIQPAAVKRKHRTPTLFDCRRINQSIPYHKRCDHKPDCEDGTDEYACSCVDYITTFDDKLLCDGIVDCADGEDERQCYSCADEEFLCRSSKTCLPLKHVCDGISDCPQGEDELECFALSNGENIALDFNGRPQISLEGFVTKKHQNNWNVICEDSMSIEEQEETATHICRYLGFSSSNRYHVKYINIRDGFTSKIKKRDTRKDETSIPINFMYRQSLEDNKKERNLLIKKPEILKEQCVPNITKTCMSLYVYCEHNLFTDLSDFGIEQNFLRYAQNEAHLWPWLAKVYVEGNYRCSGILIDLSWVLVSHTCLWDSLLIQSYISVVLGSQRILQASHGPDEQIYQVNGKKDLYHSKVALLHLKSPAHYSHSVKPMAVPSFKDNNREKDEICIAVGQDDKNRTINVILKETDEDCEIHSRCFIRQNLKRLCDDNDITMRPWVGIVTCHGPDGWYPAASFVEHAGECKAGDRIEAIDIGNLKSDMKKYIKKSFTESTEQTTTDICNGHRCARGKCLSFGLVCDGIRNCEDGADESEASCERKEKICNDDPHHRGCECAIGELKCKNGKCIAKERFGDGNNDCGDNSDEPEHKTCAQYLARWKPLRLCDGILHCQDKTDEDPLFCKCFSRKSYKCGASDHCVAPDLVCDGTDDCPNGEDEGTCLGLYAPEGTPYGTGEVILNSHGVWHTKCYSKPNHTRSELESICRDHGFISGHAKQLKITEGTFTAPTKVVLDPFNDIILNNKTRVKLRNTDEPLARAVRDETSPTCYPLFIECL